MEKSKEPAEQLRIFAQYLRREERSKGTVEKYLRDASAFVRWLNGRPVTKEAVLLWRDDLLARGYAPVTVNSMLAALHALFRFAGWEECRVKYLKIQRRLFRDEARNLSRGEYARLIAAAQKLGKERLALLLETMGATGIRVSEVKYITVETAAAGQAEIALKGKLRTILIPAKLCRKLQRYARKQKNASGEIFLTRSGKSLSRRQIWSEMKGLCKYADVNPSKVFPHNLRHLFATVFYQIHRDIAGLADVLGHSSIETTRLYLAVSSTEQARRISRLRLIS